MSPSTLWPCKAVSAWIAKPAGLTTIGKCSSPMVFYTHFTLFYTLPSVSREGALTCLHRGYEGTVDAFETLLSTVEQLSRFADVGSAFREQRLSANEFAGNQNHAFAGRTSEQRVPILRCQYPE